MTDSIYKLYFPNPLNHIELGDKAIKLKELNDCIEAGEITIIVSDSTADFKSFINKITFGKEYLLPGKYFFSFGILKRKAEKLGKAIVLQADFKKFEKLQKRKGFFKYVKFAVQLNHKPYYYIAGSRHNNQRFDIGWTVTGAKILKTHSLKTKF